MRIVWLPGSTTTSLPSFTGRSRSKNANSIARKRWSEVKSRSAGLCQAMCQEFIKPVEFQTQWDTLKIHQQRHPSLKKRDLDIITSLGKQASIRGTKLEVDPCAWRWEVKRRWSGQEKRQRCPDNLRCSVCIVCACVFAWERGHCFRPRSLSDTAACPRSSLSSYTWCTINPLNQHKLPHTLSAPLYTWTWTWEWPCHGSWHWMETRKKKKHKTKIRKKAFCLLAVYRYQFLFALVLLKCMWLKSEIFSSFS